MQYLNKPLITFPVLSLNQDDAPQAPGLTPQTLRTLPPNNLYTQARYTQTPVATSSKPKITSARPFAKSNIALLEFVRAGGL